MNVGKDKQVLYCDTIRAVTWSLGHSMTPSQKFLHVRFFFFFTSCQTLSFVPSLAWLMFFLDAPPQQHTMMLMMIAQGQTCSAASLLAKAL